MLARLVLIMLIGLILLILIIGALEYLNYLKAVEEHELLASWRPTLAGGLFQCPNGYAVGPGNATGPYPCGPCLILVNSTGIYLACPN